MAGLYLHIPFCKQACYYCDFHFSTNQDIRRELVDCMIRELRLQKDYLNGASLRTIYFGGGTPSLLTETELADILTAIHDLYDTSKVCEITLEANPDDLTAGKLTMLRSAGINRLSIGIQTFQDHLLQFLHRAHTADGARACMQLARMAGFDNISADLIYGIPGESEDMLVHDLNELLALHPQHVSCYSLTVEEKTVFGKWSRTGKLRPVDDDVSAQHLELVRNTLRQHGYEHYEVSNFALPGFHSQHNSSYWTQEPYLGIGPSAHSFNGTTRHYTISNNHHYCRSLEEGRLPSEQEVLSREDRINEVLLTSLRTARGCDLSVLQGQFGYNLLTNQQVYIERLLQNNWAILAGQHLILTEKGLLLADSIASDLFLLP